MNEQKKDIEKRDDSITEFVSGIVEAVNETIENVIETVSETIGTSQTKEIEEAAETNAQSNEENRVGYVPAIVLPQADETEEEALVELPDEPDPKNEIEAAIAKARETHEETEEEIKDPLVAETLPALPRLNRARLQIQAPNRVHLYWSLAGNPFETLRRAFGNRADNYVLVTKLVNLQTGATSYSPAQLQGDWWYNVRSNSPYRVDLGFYAPNHPFIRLLSSNDITTPRPAPSARVATEADWVVSTRQFVKVLTASGYSHDVLGVAFGAGVAQGGEIAGDAATITVANRLAPNAPAMLGDLNLAELRWVLVSLAAGVDYRDLFQYLSAETAAWLEQVLEANPNALEAENVRNILESIFGSEFVQTFIEQDEFTWQRLAPVAVGASAIHFPEILFPKLRSSERKPGENPFSEGDLPFDLSPLSSAEFLV